MKAQLFLLFPARINPKAKTAFLRVEEEPLLVGFLPFKDASSDR
jgi:hypothetical protein